MAHHGLTIGLWHLGSKLVAREVEDHQTLLAVLLLQIRQLLVVVLGQAALGGDVDHQDHLALVLVQGNVISMGVLHGELVNRGGVLVISVSRHVDLEEMENGD